VSLLELVRELESVLGFPAKIRWLPDQPGDVPQTWAAIEKARELLGYEPRTPLRQGLSRFVEWLATSGDAARATA
jgi:UDP-glucuronate 4-epimerase